MLLIKNLSTDPYYNMAAEEYFMTSLSEDAIMLWRNDNTVVVGKNQNAVEEIDADFVREHKIRVVRRLSGGGAVFHDLGNINFTMIQKYNEELFSNYGYFTQPVCAFLKTLGINAELSGRNDLLIDGMKFSGNAQTKFSGKIMHHGTLLFSANPSLMAGALKPCKLKIESKSIKSVRSRVTNISEHMEIPMSPEVFFEKLYSFFLSSADAKEYEITKEDDAAILRLRDEKYATWEWNYGKSPKCTIRNAEKYDFGIVDLRMDLENGIIKTVKIYGDFFGTEDVSPLETSLTGIRYNKADVKAALAFIPLSSYICGMAEEELVALMFD